MNIFEEIKLAAELWIQEVDDFERKREEFKKLSHDIETNVFDRDRQMKEFYQLSCELDCDIKRHIEPS